MSAATYDITVEQGATFLKVITWKDSSAVPINLTGFTARMQIRERVSSAAAVLDISTDDYIVLGGAAGTITITVPATVTAALNFTRGVYDLEVESPGNVVTRLLQGGVELSKEVTR